MKSIVTVYDAKTLKEIFCALYCLPVKEALTAGYYQLVKGNFDTWKYKPIPGSKSVVNGRLFYDDGEYIVYSIAA